MTPPNLSLFFIMVCFWVTLWIVFRFLIRPIGRVLAERRERIDGADKEWTSKHEDYLSATERLQTEIEDAARQAAQTRNEHRQGALEARQGALEAARADAEGKLQSALQELEGEAGAARDDLRRRAAELARLFASQLLEREVGS